MEENNKIILEDENGQSIEFEVIDVYDLDGVTYFAMVEAEDAESAEEVLIMRVEGEGDDAELVTIESEAELEAAFDEFVKRDNEECDCGGEDCGCGCHHE